MSAPPAQRSDAGQSERSVSRSALQGAAWLAFTIVVWAAWPSFTRLAVTEAVTPEDVVLLRYGIGGLILLPFLLRGAANMPRRAWRDGMWLALFQGAPVAALTAKGLALAPASHMVALSPGLMPLFTSLLSYLLMRERISRLRAAGLVLIVGGALAIGGVSLGSMENGHWRGDLLFICAGLLGSIYLLRMRESGLTALQAAALISVYSMVVYVPLFAWLWLDSTRLTTVSPPDLVFQAFYQGVLMGAVTLFSLGRAVVLVGPASAATCLALLPVTGMLMAVVVLGEMPSVLEAIGASAISAGAVLATGILRKRSAGHV